MRIIKDPLSKRIILSLHISSQKQYNKFYTTYNLAITISPLSTNMPIIQVHRNYVHRHSRARNLNIVICKLLQKLISLAVSFNRSICSHLLYCTSPKYMKQTRQSSTSQNYVNYRFGGGSNQRRVY